MLLSEFRHIVDGVIPVSEAMTGDIVGLHTDSKRSTANNVLICLEVTDDVVEEAVSLGCDTILSFHPLIYSPLARIDRTERVGRLVAQLIEADIALLCIHTAFDAFPQGTNAILAQKLGLRIVSPLKPSQTEGFGMGLVTQSAMPIPIEEFVETVQSVCKGPVRYTEPPNCFVERVAIVAGSGMTFFDAAVASGADTFITSDVRYHGFHAAKDVIGIIDPGHYEMEQFVPEGIFNVLRHNIPSESSLVVSQVVTNPVQHAFSPNTVYSQHQPGTS